MSITDRDKNHFDNEYILKRWDYLNSIEELAHYSIIVGYVRFYYDKPSILDVGCGEGVLLRKFSSNHYNLYHGLDFSKVAIESCKKHANSKVELFNTNISNFETDNKFDCVIFCESLCYMKNIQQILNKFKFFLKSNGKIIISCFDELSTRQFWDHIPNEFNLISSTSVFNSKDMKWNIKLFDIPARDVT